MPDSAAYLDVLHEQDTRAPEPCEQGVIARSLPCGDEEPGQGTQPLSAPRWIRAESVVALHAASRVLEAVFPVSGASPILPIGTREPIVASFRNCGVTGILRLCASSKIFVPRRVVQLARAGRRHGKRHAAGHQCSDEHCAKRSLIDRRRACRRSGRLPPAELALVDRFHRSPPVSGWAAHARRSLRSICLSPGRP